MTKCSAPNCGNSLKKDNAEFSFHEFPEDPVLRKQWLSNIGRANWVPGRRSTICSVHFEETQIERLDQNIKLIKGAVPTIFSTTKRKRHSQNQRNNKVKIVLHSPVAEVLIEDAKHFKACPEKGQESQLLEFNIAEVSSLSSDSTNQADGLRLGANSENPISEVVLIDGSYVLEGCDFLQQESQMLNSNQSAENPILQETVKYVDGFQLEAGGELSDESCVLNENIICIEPSTTCSNLTADLTESSESKRNSVIIIEQSVDLSEEEQVLPNLSNIATPREKTNSFPADSESSALETPSFQINIKTDHSLQNKELDVSESERCSEMKRIHESTVQLSPSLSEGVIDLPLSMASHMHAVQNHSSDIRWQFGTFMCRLCGVARDKTLNLFSPEASQCRLLERISSVLHIKIVEKDDVPQSVCSVCLTKLDSCSELIVTSFHTHQHFVSVIDGDVKISSKLPFYCDYVEEKDPRLHCYKKHLLLMEIYHEEGKPINEYLTVACNDLLSRLDCKDLDRGSRCSLLLAPISDDCYVSEVEQARAAAEALIIKGITQNKRQSDVQDCKNMDNTSNSTESLSEESVRDLTLTEFLPPEESHGSFELHPLDYQVLSSVDKTDSCELKCFKPRCPKVANSWHTKNTVFNKMQKIFFWSELEDGQIKLVCRSCRKAFDKSFNFTKHIDNCSDQSMVVGSSLSNSIQENIDTSVEPKCPTKSDRNNGEKVWKSCGNKNSGCWYQCSFCSVRLQSKTILKEHLSQHHATKSTKCEGCGYKTLNVDEVTLRCEMCSQSNITTTWRCQMCVESFHSESKLKEHHAITGHCNDSSSWLCDVCGKSYSLATKLDEHKKSHLAPEFKYIHQCSQCPKRYINKSKLKEHMLRHEEKKFMCKVCGKLFGTKQILRQHEFTHGDPQYLCALCSRTFFRKSHLLKHMNVHNPDNPRTNRSGPQPHRDGLNRCRECKNVFGNDLLEHYKTCHPHIPLHHYICEICKQENTSYAELFQHQREAHKTGVKECPFCNKTIDGSTQMKYHLMKHEGMFPYNCSLCSNGYTANSLLQDHMRRKHTGEKPFQCQQCSKCFPSNGSLVQHSAVHTLPHQLLPCPVCNQGFKRKAHLDVHLRTHTGEKPYQCPICDRPFRQRPDCVKHIRIVHGEDPTKFKIRFHSNTSISFPQVVSVADMELVLEGEDLMQTSLESSHTTVCQ